jgi:hypothetical protein
MARKKTVSPPEESLVVSTLIFRRLVGILGIALPFALVLWTGLSFQLSISAYYYTPGRNLFVGVMCVVGAFLCCYKGYDIRDKALCLVAGIAAILVGLVPMAQDVDPFPAQVRGWFHLFFAAVFLGCLAALSLFQFTQTDARTAKAMTPQKIRRNRVYRLCGWVMVGCLGAIVLYKFPLTKPLLDFLTPLNPVFDGESLAVIAFGISWLTKGEGLEWAGL